MKATASFFAYWRAMGGQRLPFLPLVLSACAGILAASLVGSWWAFFCAVLLLVLAAWRGWHWALFLGVVCAFAAIHRWQSVESLESRFLQEFSSRTYVEGSAQILSHTQSFEGGGWSARASISQMRAGEGGSLGKFDFAIPLRILVEGHGDALTVGSEFSFRGSLEEIEGARNPGEFDKRDYLQRAGIYQRIVLGEVKGVVPGTGLWLDKLAQRTHDRIKEILSLGVDTAAPTTQLVVAMATGDTADISQKMKDCFQRTGTPHLFAVSGLHVGLLGGILYIVLVICRVPRKWIVAIVVPTLFFYALVTGWKPASIRAATMMAFVLAGGLLGRPATVLNSLLAAGFAILLFDTNELFNAGFQLSFLVVLALGLVAEPLGEGFASTLRPDPFIPPRIYNWWEMRRYKAAQYAAPVAATAVVAWVATMPLIAYIFHIVSLVAVPANLICVPMASIVMALALAAVISGFFWPALAAIFNNANIVAAGVIVESVRFFSAMPFAAIPVAVPVAQQVTVLDLGRGSSIAIEVGGKFWLVDCGPRWKWQGTLAPFLRLRGIERPHGLIVTHGDANHIGSSTDLLQLATPQQIFFGMLDGRSPTRKSLELLAIEKEIPMGRLEIGNELALGGGAVLRTLYPAKTIESGLADDRSLVLMLDIGGKRILLLGDAGNSTEAALLTSGADIKCDILVKGAHSSGIAITEDFLAAAAPSIFIASHADFPASEQFRPEIEEYLATRGISLYRQDRTGAVIITIEKQQLQIRSFFQK